jgi:vancomycin aglycone glucosyltransferase
MRALLSTIGSRGDVQPLVALASRLRTLGHEVQLCVPPDFREWIESLGLSVTPIGPVLRRPLTSGVAAAPFAATPEQVQQMVDGSVAAQFSAITAAAQGCDIIVGATALQIAARSVAELMEIPYVFTAYCPNVLPSPDHAPPALPPRDESPSPTLTDNRALWARDTARFTDTFGAALNAHRSAAGLAPVTDVHSHILGVQPLLAADPTLAPWPDPTDTTVFQTGAWILPDTRPLSDALQRFLDAGAAPIYMGFGSMRAVPQSSTVMIETARRLGRRVIVSRGWAELELPDGESDCIAIDEVNLEALLPRVAAVVHHGGAGTTTAAARAGAPQVVIPQIYDQHYFAQRVDLLGIGVAHAPGAPTVESLTDSLERALQSNIAMKARSIAPSIRADGAEVAATHLISIARNSLRA